MMESVVAATVPEVGMFAGLVKTVAALPISAWIKAGVFVGVAAVTGFILIKSFFQNRKNMKAAETVREPGAFFFGHHDNDLTPTDIAVAQSYTANPSIFDRLDPIAQDVSRDVDMNGGRRKNGKKRFKKYTREMIDQIKGRKTAQQVASFPKTNSPECYDDSDWGIHYLNGTQKQYRSYADQLQDEADEAAKRLGLKTIA